MRRPLAVVAALALASCECGVLTIRTPDGGVDGGGSDDGGRDAGPDGGTDAGVDAGADAGADAGTDAGVDAGTDAGVDAGDPCPTLGIPATCFNRDVVYREWGPGAVGDGTYFASQAPWRLGFNRLKGLVWIVKVRTDSNSYLGRLSAYGDNSGGVEWISDQPCDATFAVANRMTSYGVHGGGSIDFVVVRDDADAARIATEPAFASLRSMPKLRGNHCYYVAFENTDVAPLTAPEFSTVVDTCGDYTMTPDCYYLAFDFGHLLYVPDSGTIFAGSVVPGLTH